MIERLFYMGSGLLLAVLAGLFCLRIIANPQQARSAWLEDQLANIPPTLPEDIDDAGEGAWQAGIEAKPELWQGLVEPPPPPPAPKPEGPKTPDLSAMLKGVRSSTRGIGNKAFMIWPQNLKGDYVSVGDTIQGCTVKEIDREFITFSYFWKEGNKEIISKLKRERGKLN